MKQTARKKVAFLRALQLGDMVCAIPAITGFRKTYPTYHITLIGLPWAKEFAKRFPHLFDDFIEFPGFPGLPEREHPKSFQIFLEKIKQSKFDLAIQMHGDGTITNTIIKKFGAKRIAGFYNPIESPKPEGDFIPYPQHLHEIKKLLALVQYLTAGIITYDVVFPISPIDVLESELLLKSIVAKRYICIHPGSKDIRKRWNGEYFSEIADILHFLGFTIVFTGTKEENTIISSIQRKMIYPSCNLAGKTNLGVLAAILQNASLLICNDTGVSHLAAGVKTKSVIIFSKFSNSDEWAPLNRKIHIPITHEKATVDTVITTALALLKSPIPMHERKFV